MDQQYLIKRYATLMSYFREVLTDFDEEEYILRM
jgi:hypothetical protein